MFAKELYFACSTLQLIGGAVRVNLFCMLGFAQGPKGFRAPGLRPKICRAPGLQDKNIGAQGLHDISFGAPGFTVIKHSKISRAQGIEIIGAPGSTANISRLQGSRDPPPPLRTLFPVSSFDRLIALFVVTYVLPLQEPVNPVAAQLATHHVLWQSNFTLIA